MRQCAFFKHNGRVQRSESVNAFQIAKFDILTLYLDPLLTLRYTQLAIIIRSVTFEFAECLRMSL